MYELDEIDKLHVRMQGLTQEEVAKESGVARVTIGHVLGRRSNYQRKTIEKINRALDRLGAKAI